MRYFPLLDLQHMVLAVFLGLIAFVLICAAWGSYPKRRESACPEEPGAPSDQELLTGPGGGHNPFAPFLVYIYIGAAVWALGYMIVIGLAGGAF